MRRTTSHLLVLLTLGALLLPAAASAQSASPFQPLPSAPQTNTDVTVAPGTTTTADDDGGFSKTAEVLLFLVGVALIGGIAWVIVRDARDHAPKEDRPGNYAGRGAPVVDDREEREQSKRRSDARKRAQAKRARQARKKNRPR